MKKSLLWVVFLIFLFKSNYAQSPYQVELDSLIPLLETEMHDTVRVGLYLKIANNFLYLHQNDSLAYYAKQLRALSLQINYPRGIQVSHQFEGFLYENQFEYQKSVDAFRKALPIIKSINRKDLIGSIYNHMARLKYKAQEYDSATYYVNLGIEIDRDLEDWRSVGIFYNTLGNIALRQHHFETAIQHYFAALSNFNRVKNVGDTWRWVAGMHNNIGGVHHRMEAYEEAIVEMEKALVIVTEQDYKPIMQLTLNNIGNCLVGLDKNEEALPYLYKALLIAEELKDTKAFVQNYNTLGTALINLDSLDKSITFARRSKQYASDMQDPFGEFFATVNLAHAYRNKRDFQVADKYYNQCQIMADTLGDPKIQMDLHEQLANYYTDRKLFESALREYKAYDAIQDSLFDVDRTNGLAEIQAKYEAAERDKEISELKQKDLQQGLQLAQSQRNNAYFLFGILASLGLGGFFFARYQTKQKANRQLEEKNELIALQNDELSNRHSQLENSLYEKEVLLKEIHHRVKNNLQLITSLLNIQAAKAPQQSIEEFLYNGQHRVKSMALIHEQLYLSDNVAAIEMGAYTKDLVSSIFESFQINSETIQYQIDSDHVLLDIDQAIPLGLIINELVNNSLKHAFQERSRGTLKVSLKENDTAITLQVEDDGQGLDQSRSENSIGLSLVKILVNQLKGTFNLSSQQGTSAQIRFSIT